MKKHVLLSLLLVALSFIQAGAQDDLSGVKLATVDMKKLINDYYRTGEIQKELNSRQAHLVRQTNDRQKAIQDIEEEIAQIRKQFEDPSLNQAKKAELNQQLQLKTQDGTAMTRQLKEWLERKRRQVSEEMQTQMRGIFQEVSEVVEAAAKERDLDFVYDKTSAVNGSLPVILYSKDRFDITEELLEVLNENAPEE